MKKFKDIRLETLGRIDQAITDAKENGINDERRREIRRLLALMHAFDGIEDNLLLERREYDLLMDRIHDVNSRLD